MGYKCMLNPRNFNAEKLSAFIRELTELGVWNGSEVVYDDSDKELDAKVKEIMDQYSK